MRMGEEMTEPKPLKTANFKIQEIWTVDCPECDAEQPAELDYSNPGQPTVVTCDYCYEKFILTFNRD